MCAAVRFFRGPLACQTNDQAFLTPGVLLRFEEQTHDLSSRPAKPLAQHRAPQQPGLACCAAPRSTWSTGPVNWAFCTQKGTPSALRRSRFPACYKAWHAMGKSPDGTRKKCFDAAERAMSSSPCYQFNHQPHINNTQPYSLNEPMSLPSSPPPFNIYLWRPL